MSFTIETCAASSPPSYPTHHIPSFDDDVDEVEEDYNNDEDNDADDDDDDDDI